MNHIKDHEERVEETKKLIEDELYILERGYNPKTKQYEDDLGINLVTPSTLFLNAAAAALLVKKLLRRPGPIWKIQ